VLILDVIDHTWGASWRVVRSLGITRVANTCQQLTIPPLTGITTLPGRCPQAVYLDAVVEAAVKTRVMHVTHWTTSAIAYAITQICRHKQNTIKRMPMCARECVCARLCARVCLRLSETAKCINYRKEQMQLS